MTTTKIKCHRCMEVIALAQLNGSPAVASVLPAVIDNAARTHMRRRCRRSCAMCMKPLKTQAQLVQQACSLACCEALRRRVKERSRAAR